MTRILVTGANGFVGRATGAALVAAGHAVRGAVRGEADLPAGVTAVAAPDLGAGADWRVALDGVEAVIHTAARVHQVRETEADPEAAFFAVNAAGTRTLAEQAAAAGVRRFVFVSSIKVLGDGRADGQPYRDDDPPAPPDAYGRSKAAAEAALAEIATRTGLEVVIVRPPLVHGPGIGANFGALVRLVARGVPLPFGAIDNRRSLVGVDNLAHALVHVTDHPAAAGRVLVVRDGEDVSTPELIRRLARAMNRPARLIAVPPGLLRSGLRLLGRGAMADRLLGSLWVEDTALRGALGWQPPLSLDDGLRRAVVACRRC